MTCARWLCFGPAGPREATDTTYTSQLERILDYVGTSLFEQVDTNRGSPPPGRWKLGER